MNFDRVLNILGGVVTIAVISVIVSNRAQTANVIRAFGTAFSSTVRAATGPVTGR